MKKILFILTIFLVLGTSAGRALAGTCPSGYSMNSNGYCYGTTNNAGNCPAGGNWSGGNNCVANPVPASAAATSGTPAVNAVTQTNAMFNTFGRIESGLLKTGPQLSSTLTSVSGQLFSYLAIIALIIFAVKELMFGDKGIKEFMIFFLFLAFARGLLAAYNLFFVQGVVYMFFELGTMVAGVSDPMTLFQNIFYDFYNILSAQLQAQGGSVWTLVASLMTALLYFVGIIVLLLSFCLVAGTILIIQFYIVIALVTGYIFVPFMIFKPLEFLWNGWLKFLLSSAISYFIVFVVVKIFALFMNNTLITYINSINSKSNYAVSSIINEISYTFILLIFGWLVTKIPGIAGEIVSGMPNMSITTVVAPIITSIKNVSGTAAKTAGATKDAVLKRAGK